MAADATAAFQRMVSEAVTAISRDHAAIIERACEESLQGGVNGVLVTRDAWSLELVAEVTDRVPYGRIHYFTKHH